MGMGNTAASGTSHVTKRQRDVAKAMTQKDRKAIHTAVKNGRRV